MIAQSQSGTGKTAAFACCVLSRVEPDKKYTQVNIAAPRQDTPDWLLCICLNLQLVESVAILRNSDEPADILYKIIITIYSVW